MWFVYVRGISTDSRRNTLFAFNTSLSGISLNKTESHVLHVVHKNKKRMVVIWIVVWVEKYRNDEMLRSV